VAVGAIQGYGQLKPSCYHGALVSGHVAKSSSINCSSCGQQIESGSRFCSSCGTLQSNEPDVTVTSTPAPPFTPKPSGRGSSRVSSRSSSFRSSSGSSSSIQQNRFVPGTLLVGRYRVVALLGRGGMGEVYRADDLTLDQPVALKFLPEATAQDEPTLERFRNEVRIARRISHPNVCRIYDIGEAEGLTFLSMEYVDGEDLSSLLRRIGRLPSDKALEIARKLCAGLAAAHDKGVLHRDLKPANIMLNSEGEVVIMDFGLADLAEHITHDQVRYGTPAYMAPEQLAGKEVTSKSDIYALGLVLYEIFTGKRAFEAKTLAEIVRTRNEIPTPASPSTVVRDIDPGVERVILRCLEPDPAMRPASVLAVAAALPGGDPLAAALAAGETPSPQMVAAAGEVEGLAPRIAVPCIAALILMLLASYLLGVKNSAFDKLQLDQSPEVLTHRAQEIISILGYTAIPEDTAYGFDSEDDYVHWVEKNYKPRADWNQLLSQRPSVLTYWYRTSPQPMVATDFKDSALTPGLVTVWDPPLILSGMIQVNLDPQGRLTRFQIIPPQREDQVEGVKPVDWAPLFSAAGIDATQLKPTEPIWNSLSSSDTRVAWTGRWPGSSRALRVEAAALHGRPVFFGLIGPWAQATRLKPNQRTGGQRAGDVILISVGVLLIIFSVLFACRNYLHRRADVAGAFRLAVFIFAAQMVLWICRSHFPHSIGFFGLLILAMSTSLFIAAFVAVLYLAVEPFVRRRWPQTIVSWSRLLLGRWRDPLVGRDMLYGLILGALWILIFQIFYVLLIHEGTSPQLSGMEFLLSPRQVLGAWLALVPNDVQGTLTFFFLIFLLRIVLRNQWLAAAGFTLIFALQQALHTEHVVISLIFWSLIYALAAIALVRFGLVSMAAAVFVTDLLLNLPVTANPSQWFIGATIFTYASVAAIGFWAFYTALAGQRLWKEELFE
jgi:serine/threonine protein kinase